MNFLIRLTLFVLVALLGAGTASAQEIDVRSSTLSVGDKEAKSGDGFTRIHVTDDLLRSPEGQSAFRNYARARDAGALTAGKRAVVADTVGQERDFNVQTSLLDRENKEWAPLNFTLRATNDVANVWVETSLDGTFSAERMDELEAYILDATPEDSFRPDNGIIENDNTIFGTPPDFDGDGAVDILLHDIDEGADQGCCVLGYVTSVDVNPHALEGQGNKRDVLYVDLPDGLRNGGVISIAGTIAHEYQHLIHLAYQDTPELTFINEGMSEWAEVMNGYFLRTINYLQDTSEHNTPLLDFRDTAPVAVRENDYQRSGLFTTYVAGRIGWEATGSIVRATVPNSSVFATGEQGYNVVLENDDLVLADVVADFHTANVVNDRSVDPRFGYTLAQRQSFVVTPTTIIDGASQNSASTTASANGGAVHYVRWTNVADLAFTVSAQLSDDGDPRSKARFHLFEEPVDGPAEVTELPSTITEHTVAGEFQEITLVVSNVAASSSVPVSFTVASEWSSGQGSFVEETTAYENGETAGQPYFTLDAASSQASKFEVPSGGRLSTVYLAPVYTNQFTDGSGDPLLPQGLSRDFDLKVWDDAGGIPGNELFSMRVVGDPSGTHLDFASMQYTFLEVDLPEDESTLSDLPSTIYIGMANSGSDENYLALTSALLIGSEDKSFVLLNGEWAAFSEVLNSQTREPVLEGRVLPIRARFLVPTADENAVELPAAMALGQNYPNPFNPSTSIEYSLPRSTHVRLVVYDVLGKEIATLVDGVQRAGEHASRVDAARWSSGVYFYTLEADGRSVTRQMIVLK